jgi:hypothetical protein
MNDAQLRDRWERANPPARLPFRNLRYGRTA